MDNLPQTLKKYLDVMKNKRYGYCCKKYEDIQIRPTSVLCRSVFPTFSYMGHIKYHWPCNSSFKTLVAMNENVKTDMVLILYIAYEWNILLIFVITLVLFIA